MQNAHSAKTVLVATPSQLPVKYLVLPILVMPNKWNISNGGDRLLHHQ